MTAQVETRTENKLTPEESVEQEQQLDEKTGGVEPTSEEEKKAGEGEDNSELILIQDSAFTVKIHVSGLEPFDLQVTSMELVQEINQMLMDKEETCHRTCFSLQLDGQTLDSFSELKAIENLRDGSVLKLVDEPYTVRQVRLHVRHINDLMHANDLSDYYNAVNCNSLTYVNELSQGTEAALALSATSTGLNDSLITPKPFDYILPGSASQQLPLLPLHSNISTTTTAAANNNTSNANSASSSKSKQGSNKDNKENKDNSNANGSSIVSASCLKQLTFSGWNPPNGKRKMKGDLLYLHVITNEDKRFHITASIKGFFVNQ